MVYDRPRVFHAVFYVIQYPLCDQQFGFAISMSMEKNNRKERERERSRRKRNFYGINVIGSPLNRVTKKSLKMFLDRSKRKTQTERERRKKFTFPKNEKVLLRIEILE